MTTGGDRAAAVVVGGGSGIGAAVAAAQRAQGLEVVVWDVAGRPDVPCDVRDPAAVDQAVAETVGRVGPPRWITVTAGVGHSGLLLDEPVEAFDEVLAVNTRGAWLAMRGLARTLIDAGQPGSVVVVTSVSAHLVDRTMGLYCASKAALDMLVRVAAFEWAPRGVRVNAVGPGVTETPMLGRAPSGSGWLAGVAARTPLGRLGQPGDIAAAVLAVHELEWVTGQSLDCDGGLSLHSPIDSFGARQAADPAP